VQLVEEIILFRPYLGSLGLFFYADGLDLGSEGRMEDKGWSCIIFFWLSCMFVRPPSIIFYR